MMLQGQTVVKRRKRRGLKILRRCWVPLGVFLSAAALGFALPRADLFRLRTVETVGKWNRLTRQEVLKAAGLQTGVPLFAVSLAGVRDGIRRLPWVRSVSVRRQVPSTLRIYIEERKPALLLQEGGEIYFVSEEGAVFKNAAKDRVSDLPVVTGFKKGENLEKVVRLVRFFEENPDFELFGLSEIHYNEATGYSIVTVFGPMEIKMGTGNFERKIGRLKTIWGYFKEHGGRVAGVDLNYEDRAFVKLVTLGDFETKNLSQNRYERPKNEAGRGPETGAYMDVREDFGGQTRCRASDTVACGSNNVNARSERSQPWPNQRSYWAAQ